MRGARGFVLPGALALAALASAGCVLPDQIESLERDVAEVRAEMEKVRAEQAAAEHRYNEKFSAYYHLHFASDSGLRRLQDRGRVY